MKFLLDQGLPRSTVLHLQALGLEAEHVGSSGLATASDDAILAEGRARGAIVVTLDADFHAILARSGVAVTVTEHRLALRRLPFLTKNGAGPTSDASDGS